MKLFSRRKRRRSACESEGGISHTHILIVCSSTCLIYIFCLGAEFKGAFPYRGALRQRTISSFFGNKSEKAHIARALKTACSSHSAHPTNFLPCNYNVINYATHSPFVRARQRLGCRVQKKRQSYGTRWRRQCEKYCRARALLF